MPKTRQTTQGFELNDPTLPAHHWKNRTSDCIVHKEKRVAYGCRVEKKNIIPVGTRRRKEPISYNEDDLAKSIQKYQKIVHKSKPTRSKNFSEARVMKDISNKIKKTRKTKQEKRKRVKQEEEEDEEYIDEENIVQETEPVAEETEDMAVDEQEVVEEPVTKTTSRKGRKTRRRSEPKQAAEADKPADLVSSVTSSLNKFGGVLSQVTLSKVSKQFRGNAVPLAQQQFSAMTVDLVNTKFINEKIVADNIFAGMTLGASDLPNEEWEQLVSGSKLNNLYIIGSGDCLFVSDIKDQSADFTVYVVDDQEGYAVHGPFKISQVFKDLAIDTAIYEDE